MAKRGRKPVMVDGVNSSRHPLRSTWRNMIRSCSDPSSPDYRWYGAKGITVDPVWLGKEGFARFVADVGHRGPGQTLGLIDKAKPYGPGNVAWMSPQTRKLRKTEARGEAVPQAKLTEADVRAIRSAVGQTTRRALSEQYGVSVSQIANIQNRTKWTHV